MQATSSNPPCRSDRLAVHPVASVRAGPAKLESAEASRTKLETLERTAREKLETLAEDSFPFRLLNALLQNSPTVEGACVIARDIITASVEPDGLDQLAEFYRTGLILPMRAGGRTPQVSFHPSRDREIKSEANEIAIDLEIAKKDPATLKKYTLHRDGYRCVATRVWDYSSLSLEARRDPSTGDFAVTEAAHILPFSLMSADTNKTLFKKCTIWSVITSFTTIQFKELSGDKINSLTNVITLDAAVHKYFGMLDLWFEAVPGMPNTYKIRKAYPNVPRYVDDGAEVTFTSPDPEIYPLPNPYYLAFHAAVAKVVHMAGMAEELDLILRKQESIRVLSDDSGLEYLDGLLRATQRYIIAR